MTYRVVPILGGFNVGTVAQAWGTALFTGPATAPVFTIGTFGGLHQLGGSGSYTMTISDVAAVPEVASWAMMIVGFGMLGYPLEGVRTITTEDVALARNCDVDVVAAAPKFRAAPGACALEDASRHTTSWSSSTTERRWSNVSLSNAGHGT